MHRNKNSIVTVFFFSSFRFAFALNFRRLRPNVQDTVTWMQTRRGSRVGARTHEIPLCLRTTFFLFLFALFTFSSPFGINDIARVISSCQSCNSSARTWKSWGPITSSGRGYREKEVEVAWKPKRRTIIKTHLLSVSEGHLPHISTRIWSGWSLTLPQVDFYYVTN